MNITQTGNESSIATGFSNYTSGGLLELNYGGKIHSYTSSTEQTAAIGTTYNYNEYFFQIIWSNITQNGNHGADISITNNTSAGNHSQYDNNLKILMTFSNPSGTIASIGLMYYNLTGGVMYCQANGVWNSTFYYGNHTFPLTTNVTRNSTGYLLKAGNRSCYISSSLVRSPGSDYIMVGESSPESWISNSTFSNMQLSMNSGLLISNAYDENNASKTLTFHAQIFNDTYSLTTGDVADYYGYNLGGDVIVTVSATGYKTRYYYVSLPADLNPFLLNESVGHDVQFTVKNYYEQLIEDAFINITKLTNSVWNVVSQGYTDSSGTFGFFLDEASNYKIYVTKEGYGSKEFNLIPSQNIYTIYMSSGTISKPSYWDYYKLFSGGCAYNNTTRLLNCSWVDSSTHMQSVYVQVQRINNTAQTLFCNNTSTSASGSLYCNFSTLNNQTFYWNMWADFGSNVTSMPVATGSWSDIIPVALGTLGILLAYILVSFSGFIGVQIGSPAVTVLMVVVGVGIAMLLGFLNFSSGMLGILIGLSVSGAMLIYKMRT